MAGDNEVHEGASVKEILIEACRRNNTELLTETLEGKSEEEIAKLLNETTTVMGNHLYHEAASRGNYEIIDLLLDQPNFECDPVNRQEGDTPLHTAIRWINSEPPAQREFGSALVDMMLEAGSSTRIRNRARLTPSQLVDPSNAALRELIQRHEYANLNAGDFVEVSEPRAAAHGAVPAGKSAAVVRQEQQAEESDDDAEFSGSDDEERAEWERRRKERRARKG
ncbi:uncharacterized protein E0L32_003195 [Thyridium curvatum]|uniref:Uncharacterized protein n=1 Tax=Thyridium curvatum TaxID=1093900 RepID=A0A507BB01_9PEZI|nr:uncharacterized protein E0L32_003195 [Thyridium curvatum]TPX17077.1 hypothetical protein E0L32_003195 [Thyridium curvatum]